MRLAAEHRTHPNSKLVFFQLAAFHNPQTGQCNPSPNRLAPETGLSPAQVARALDDLARQKVIARGPSGFAFPSLNVERNTVPANWHPSERAMTGICERYPNYHFSMQEAVDDFIQFAKQTGAEYADIDAGFIRSISAILDNRPAGPVEIKRQKRREREDSVRDFLAGTG